MLTSYGTEKNDTGTVPPPRPTMVRSPTVRATATPSARVASAPTKSSTTSAPRPPVACRISSAASAPDSTVWSAP